MKHIEHLGIAVKDLAQANETFRKLLGRAAYKQESVEREGVITSFFQIGESKLELLESSGSGGPIGKFLESRGEGMHHIAIEVENIESEMERLRSEGFVLLHDKPLDGADNKRICFIHPKSCHGVLVEICQDKG